MYGDDDDTGTEDSRPLSFVEHLDKAQRSTEPAGSRLRLVRTDSDPATQPPTDANRVNGGIGIKKAQTFPARLGSANESPKSPLPSLSPTLSLRDVQSAASNSQFPLTDIDNPSDIAQELSNLQALRRMSMDVGNQTTDPDLLQFSGVSLMEMPSIAPTGDDDEMDPSRLLWVPARVHPELEPTAFKNFLEKRVQSIKRRSGDSLLSVDGLQPNNSGSLRRKKSMLSRQVNTSNESGEGYVDGAEKLARQRSLDEHAAPEVSLSELVNDPTKAVQKLAQDSRQADGEGDSPILPVAPGAGLRRSTNTTYRKGGSQRYGDRAPFSKRLVAKQAEKKGEEAPLVPTSDHALGKPLARVQSEPVAENYSRPTRSVWRQQNLAKENHTAMVSVTTASDELAQDELETPAASQSLPVRSASTSALRTPVPQTVETPPADEEKQSPLTLPQRSSSQKSSSQQPYPQQPPLDAPPARSNKRPVQANQLPTPGVEAGSVKEQASASNNALAEISHPHPLPGSGGTTTSSLTFIPTFDSIERKLDRRNKDKDDSDSVVSHKSTSSWKWFKSDDKEKKKREKEKEKEREEQARTAKSKAGEKSHDHARMDVLQNSIDNVPKGRESLRLDRDSFEGLPQEERKKETNRKSSEGKKDKEGFFGGLFGGSKKKADKDGSHKKKERRAPSPEPPPRVLRPDIDYPWTRFPIIEERAVYRMAHIKLANPRRSLHSQVLLSNFMYSYLAKVQAMHPQLQIPVSPQQKRLEEERKRREAEQAQLQLEQQMAQQAGQDGGFNFEYHRSGNNQYGDAPVQHDGGGAVQYVDDAQIYEYEHGGQQQQHHHHRQDGYGPEQGQAAQGKPGHVRQGSGGGGQGYYYAQDNTKHCDDDDDDNGDMW